MEPMSNAFGKAIDVFTENKWVPFLTFFKGQRKDDLAKEYLAKSDGKEGIDVETLDNGILSCENPARMPEIANELSAE